MRGQVEGFWLVKKGGLDNCDEAALPCLVPVGGYLVVVLPPFFTNLPNRRDHPCAYAESHLQTNATHSITNMMSRLPSPHLARFFE